MKNMIYSVIEKHLIDNVVKKHKDSSRQDGDRVMHGVVGLP